MNATNGRVNILPCPNATRAIVDHRSFDSPSMVMSRPKSMLRLTNEKRLKAKKLAVKQKEKLEAGIGASIRDEDY